MPDVSRNVPGFMNHRCATLPPAHPRPLVLALLAKRANANAAAKDGSTPLMRAAEKGYADVVRALLARGAKAKVANREQKTALAYAEAGGQVGDTGEIATPTGVFAVEETQRPHPDVIVHIGTVREGFVRTGQPAHATVDGQRRTTDPKIFAIGDIACEPMLAHKAMHEAKVAVEAICGRPAAFDPACIPAVVYTDPEVA